MANRQAEYSISELAQAADVSVRTIRFYINEGLLPAAPVRGRYAVYSQEYLDRLELIGRLKEAFLPLKEIRATLMGLSWEAVRATLEDLRRQDAARPPGTARPPSTAGQKEAGADYSGGAEGRSPGGRIGESRSSALEYIADLLSSTPANRPLPPPRPAVHHLAVSPAPTSGADPETWQRLRLGPGVELHVRQPLAAEDAPKIEALLRLAQKLFHS